MSVKRAPVKWGSKLGVLTKPVHRSVNVIQKKKQKKVLSNCFRTKIERLLKNGHVNPATGGTVKVVPTKVVNRRTATKVIKRASLPACFPLRISNSVPVVVQPKMVRLFPAAVEPKMVRLVHAAAQLKMVKVAPSAVANAVPPVLPQTKNVLTKALPQKLAISKRPTTPSPKVTWGSLLPKINYNISLIGSEFGQDANNSPILSSPEFPPGLRK